jgi:hypothetical protein
MPLYALSQERGTVPHCRGIWVHPRAGLDGYEEWKMYCPYQGLNPGLSGLQQVAIVATLSWSPPGWSGVNEIFTKLVINAENHTNYKKIDKNYELYL